MPRYRNIQPGENSWYDNIRTETTRPPKLHPFLDRNVDVNDLKENEYTQPNGEVIAKIPQIKGRITRRTPSDRGATYIELIIGEHETAEGNHRNDKVIIGTDLCDLAPGRMKANEKYHDYFDKNGRLFNDPLGRQREQKARLKAQAEAEIRKTKEAKQQVKQQSKENQAYNKDQQNAEETKQNRTGERTVDEIRESLLQKEQELNRRLQDLREKKQEAEQLLKQLQDEKDELENLIEIRKYDLSERATNRLNLLDGILDSYAGTVKEQARRKPNMPMSLAQIRMINELLRELRNWFRNSESEDYLHLAEEPREDDPENHPGTTYGEMAILLSAYIYTINACRYNRLYWKDQNPEDESGEEEPENEEDEE